MKKSILSLIMLSFFFVAMAQKSEITAAKNNYALFEIGLQTKASIKKQLETLELAKANTEKAILNEKTKDLPELWAYRGVIYSSIAVTDTVNKSNAEAAFKTAQEAIAKAKSLDAKSEFKQQIENAEKNLAIMMQNKGVAAFAKKDYKEAYNSFKFISEVMPKDSLFSMYTAIAANSAQLYDEAIKYYSKTIEINPKNPSLYQELGRIYLIKSDTAAALKVIEAGRTAHPEYMGLVYDELNIYLNKGEASKQIAKIENAIAKDPKNKTLLFVAGVAYSAAKQRDKAEASYKKALELDPNYADAIYNLAIIYIDRGNNYIIEANKLPNNKASEAKYNDLKKKFETELSNAIPLLEKARELNPKDVNTLTTLREVYVKTNKLEKATEVKKALEQL
jgi:tetratricopeptide (TPR) repeat protein